MKKDLNWYLKWIATVILIVGTAVTNLKYYPEGPLILAAGGAIWLVVSIRWREPSLIVTNAVMLATGLATLAYKHWF
jgi:hypothetical protein